MAALNELLASIPLPVQLAFGGIGLLAVASKVLSYVRLLLSLFVLSGTNVSVSGLIRRLTQANAGSLMVLFVAPKVRQEGQLGCRNGCFRWPG